MSSNKSWTSLICQRGSFAFRLLFDATFVGAWGLTVLSWALFWAVCVEGWSCSIVSSSWLGEALVEWDFVSGVLLLDYSLLYLGVCDVAHALFGVVMLLQRIRSLTTGYEPATDESIIVRLWFHLSSLFWLILLLFVLWSQLIDYQFQPELPF